MPAEDLFDGFMRFGDRILHGIDHDERAARKYKWLLGQINELLKTTHGMVVKRLERILDADRPAEAEAALAELRADALEESFRMEGMCDSFAGLGGRLDELTYQSEHEHDSVAPDVGEVRGLATRLANREREVARIYTEQIAGLANLGGVDGDLPGLKKRASEVKQVLTDQMADFAVKARRFTRLSS